MANEINIALVRAGFEALSAGDFDACLELDSPDLVINLAELAEPLHGRDIWLEGAAMFRRAFPDLNAEIEDIFGSGDRVAVRVRMRGTHAGEYLGIPATGRQVSYVSHEFYRIENGLIAEEWICSDTAGLFGQIS
jgi:steroid delta-isomerase-like uncharacterized protein